MSRHLTGKALLAIALVACVIIAAIIYVIIYVNTCHGRSCPTARTAVPNVAGCPLLSAQHMIKDAGLNPWTWPKTSKSTGHYAVRTIPIGGTTLKLGKTVEIFQSTGKGRRYCPY
jgi:beta-lactam-binding protein with PASTA domain